MAFPSSRQIAVIAVVTLGGIAIAQRIPATRGVLVPPDPSPISEYGAAVAGYTESFIARLRGLFN